MNECIAVVCIDEVVDQLQMPVVTMAATMCLR